MHILKCFSMTVEENLLHRFLVLDAKSYTSDIRGLYAQHIDPPVTVPLFSPDIIFMDPVSNRLNRCDLWIPKNFVNTLPLLLFVQLEESHISLAICINSGLHVLQRIFICRCIVLADLPLLNAFIANFTAMSSNTCFLFFW